MQSEKELAERPALYSFAAAEIARASARKVLDVACGEGGGTRMISEGNPGAEVWGIDYDGALIASARRFESKNVRFEQGDARSMRFESGAFDAVVSCHTIEHFSEGDQRRFLAEVRRVLRGGGALVIATPDRDVWAALGIAGTQEDHIRELTRTEFCDMVEKAGFRIEGTHGQQVMRSEPSALRKSLNVLKRLDVFRLRSFLRPLVRAADERTRPTSPDTAVVPLESGKRASTTVIVARKIDP